MKKLIVTILTLSMILSLAACSSTKDKSVFDLIKESPAARLELPDGSNCMVDSEIDSLKTIADLRLQAAPMEPSDSESDWLYRIVFNPSEKVKNTEEIILSFHQKYVQIGTEFYLPEEGVNFEDILDLVETKFEKFMPQEPGKGSYIINIGKTNEEISLGTHMLSEEETAKVMTAIALSVDENGWINDEVTNSARSCVVMILDLLGISTYHYSAYDGIFNDLENIRSLKLTDEAKSAVNSIFSNYISLETVKMEE